MSVIKSILIIAAFAGILSLASGCGKKTGIAPGADNPAPTVRQNTGNTSTPVGNGASQPAGPSNAAAGQTPSPPLPPGTSTEALPLPKPPAPRVATQGGGDPKNLEGKPLSGAPQ